MFRKLLRLDTKKRISKKNLLRLYVIDELSRYIKDIDNLIILVDSLNKKLLRKLCWLLSEGRKNSVFKIINDKRYKWTFEEVPVEKIYLRPMNPRMKKALEKYDYKLLQFSKSKEAKRFKELEYDKEINRDILLAGEKDGRIILIDGCHRAISLVKEKKNPLKLIVGREKVKKEHIF